MGRSVLCGALLISLSLMQGVVGLAAQTRFVQPDTAVDLANYPNVFACLAATGRVRSTIEAKSDWLAPPDTMPWNYHAYFDPLPAPVVATAKACTQRFGGEHTSLAEFSPLFTLYLRAGEDAQAAALLHRRLAAIHGAQQAAEYAAVVDSVIDMYYRAQPMRIAVADSLAVSQAGRIPDRALRLRAYFTPINWAWLADDTAYLRLDGERILAIADSLSPTERTAISGGMGAALVYASMRLASEREVLQALAESTGAYVHLLKAIFENATGTPWISPIGEKAPPISADFWFPRDTVAQAGADASVPTPGRVALVAFLDRQPCVEGNHQFGSTKGYNEGSVCWSTGINLRRLATQFPELQIAVVAHTQGYFMYAAPPEPKTEAGLIARWMRAHQIPGEIAVTASRFDRVAPSLDNRRINAPDPNLMAYKFNQRSAQQKFYLIDGNGRIVDVGGLFGLTGRSLAELRTMIGILLHRTGHETDTRVGS